MGRERNNTFRKALRHLKSSQIDEKLQLLSEIPTNNTTGIYVIEPESIVQDPDIPGEVTREANFDQDALNNGRDTTGLFDVDNTTILTIEPPGDTTYILGPMSAMWYAWGNFSTIGYIRQSDRRMVDLGRITGQLGSWNGSSNFTSYGQLSLEQAVWFRDTPKHGADNDTPNYRAFYPGPPSNAPDQYGRYLCVITGTSKETTVTPPPRRVPPVMGNPNDAGYPWGLPPEVADQRLRGGKTASPVGDLAILLTAAGIVGAAALAFKAAVAAGGAAALGAIASRLRYLAKLRIGRGALNPFGQTAVRSGAAGRQRVDVYTGRPYQGPRGDRTGTQYGTTNQQTANTYTNPGALRGTPGTGSQTNPAGTLDKGTLPQRYLDKYGSRSVLGQKQVKTSPSAARRTFGESIDLTKINDLSNEFIEKLFSQYSDPYKKVDELLLNIEKYLKSKKSVSESNEAFVLSQNRRRILHEIKKPYVLPEQPKQKYKIKLSHNNKNINVDLMKKAEVPSSFKKAEDKMWGKYEKEQNARMSQERKNEVLDHLGGSDHFWEFMTETSRSKNKDIQYTNFDDKSEKVKGKIVRKEELKGDHLVFLKDEKTNEKKTMLQSEINELLAQENMPDEFKIFFEQQNETERYDQDPLFKKVSKRLKKEIDYPDKPAKNGYPNDPPPEMVNGMHPDLVDGKKTMETKKYDWRKELNEMLTTADVFFTTLNPPENPYANPIVTTSTRSISSINAINSNTRLITLGTFDLSSIDQFQVSASRLGSGGTNYAWVLQANGTIIAAGGENDPIRVANLALFKSGNVTLTLRQSTSSGEASDSSVTGWAVNNVKFYRTTPANVFVSLDSPEATSFIRTDPSMSNLSPAERLQKLKELLASGDEYVEKMLGADFPGTGAVPPGEYDPFKQAPAGEAGDTPGVEISNFDTSKMEKDYGQIAGFDATYEMIKSGQVPFMKPPAARQLLLNPKYQKLWDDDPGALKTIQRLAV
jgi:hypothetical protein